MFIINTGDPSKTANDFSAVIDNIRSVTFVCTVSIPAPPDGREFNKQRVRVTYTSGSSVNELTYDSSCTGDLTWHCDDEQTPTKILHCEDTCDNIKNDPSTEIEVEFTCSDTIHLPH